MRSYLHQSVHILQLKGTRAERARAHGEYVAKLAEAERNSLVFTPLAKKNQNLIKRATAKMPGLSPLISTLYEAFVLERFLHLPKQYRAKIEPFARASKLPLKTIWLSLYQPDMLMVLAASAGKKIQAQFLEGAPGCSTASVYANDSVYMMRNLDYPAAGFWEKHPAVCYHEPTDPGVQNYVSISSLGIHTAGLTGFNESGIAFSLHAHFSKKTSISGVPIFFLGEEIMESARNLEDAIELCRKFKTMGSWAMNLTSFHEKKSICVEISDQSIFIREPDKQNFLAHANAFQSPKFHREAIDFTGAMFEDSEARKRSLEISAEKLAENFTWSHAFSALASHEEPFTKKIRVFGNTVSLVTTIQSVGLDPKEKRLYLSVRSETPVTLGPYLSLPFRFDEINPKQFDNLTKTSTEYDEAFHQALHLYHQAYVSWQVVGGEAITALEYIRAAAKCVAQDPHLQMQQGYFEMIEGNYREALECFDRALNHSLSSNLLRVAHYFRAACHDLTGNREQALLDYQKVLVEPKNRVGQASVPSEKLMRRARAGLKRPYRARYCQKITPDLQFAEPLEYT